MRRTIQIGDKYKPLMDYYEGVYDKEEFNIFLTQLLVAYKKMKDKNIDLITLTELMGNYDIDLITLIQLVSQSSERLPKDKIQSTEQYIQPMTSSINIKAEKEEGSSKVQRTVKMERKQIIHQDHDTVDEVKTKVNIKTKMSEKKEEFFQPVQIEKKEEESAPIKFSTAPILGLGIDLSD